MFIPFSFCLKMFFYLPTYLDTTLGITQQWAKVCS